MPLIIFFNLAGIAEKSSKRSLKSGGLKVISNIDYQIPDSVSDF